MLVEPSIFDRDNCLRQMRRQIRSRQLVPFEYATCGENVALGTFERQGALGGFNLKAAGDRQCRNAVEQETEKKTQSKHEKCRQILRTKSRQAGATPHLGRDAMAPACESGFQAEIGPASMLDRRLQARF